MENTKVHKEAEGAESRRKAWVGTFIEVFMGRNGQGKVSIFRIGLFE